MKIFKEHSKILLSVTVIALAFFVFMFSWMRSDVKDLQAELENVRSVYEEVSLANEELNYLIEEANEPERMEYLARLRNYSYSDEKVYFNLTPGN